jgi:uncharacterized protein
MPLLANLRHLEDRSLRLQGELAVAELDLELRDELIQAEKPLRYDVEVEHTGDALLVQGDVLLPLKCECVRCLKSFAFQLRLDDWTLHLPLSGEDQVSVSGDCVDLTPFLREDILLEFPQHPLCEAECRGLPVKAAGKTKKPGDAGVIEGKASAWTALDKLKLNN